MVFDGDLPTEDFHLICSRPCWAYTSGCTGQTSAVTVFAKIRKNAAIKNLLGEPGVILINEACGGNIRKAERMVKPWSSSHPRFVAVYKFLSFIATRGNRKTPARSRIAMLNRIYSELQSSLLRVRCI